MSLFFSSFVFACQALAHSSEVCLPDVSLGMSPSGSPAAAAVAVAEAREAGGHAAPKGTGGSTGIGEPGVTHDSTGNVSQGNGSPIASSPSPEGLPGPVLRWSGEQQVERVLAGHTAMATFLPDREAEGEREEEEEGEHSAQGRVPAYASQGAVESAGRRVVLSGSFNPLHEGHLGLMRAALRCGRRQQYELHRLLPSRILT